MSELRCQLARVSAGQLSKNYQLSKTVRIFWPTLYSLNALFRKVALGRPGDSSLHVVITESHCVNYNDDQNDEERGHRGELSQGAQGTIAVYAS